MKTSEIENKIVYADCFDVLEKIENESIDCVLTDPPYNTTSCPWDKNKLNISRLFSEYRRIVKPNGNIIVFGNNPFTSFCIVDNIDIYRYSLVWIKPNSTSPNLARYQPLRRYEDVMVFCKGKGTYNPIKIPGKPYKWNSKRSGGATQNISYKEDISIENTGWRYPTNVLEFKQERGLHPTQKPLALCEHLVKLFTNEGDLCLDSFCGSGSICCAEKKLSRRFIGIENDINFFKIANERIDRF